MKLLRLIPLAVALIFPFSESIAADKVVLITLDGLRWQEVYTGIDEELLDSAEFTKRQDYLRREFWRADPDQRSRALMPFLHSTIFEQGVHVGDLRADSCAELKNGKNFSYPGYSEILTGVIDDSITSNDKVPNEAKSFMELLIDLDGEGDRYSVAAFTSWDVFPFILNVERSGIYVNAFGALEEVRSAEEAKIQELYFDIPQPWTTVRNDAFTHRFAMEYLEREKPDVLYISYGETDDFAHDGKYHEYITAAHRTDRFIEDVWQRLQSMAEYRNKTTLLVTTDHGRGHGPGDGWMHHGPTEKMQQGLNSLERFESGRDGEEAVWIAAIGPDVPSSGSIPTRDRCITSDRIASTLLHTLGIDYSKLNSAMGEPIREFLK